METRKVIKVGGVSLSNMEKGNGSEVFVLNKVKIQDGKTLEKTCK